MLSPARGRAARVLDALVPHERSVFELLNASADTSARSLALLEHVVHHWPDARDLQARLVNCSRQADEQGEAVFAHVHRTFVTSLEREDILILADALHAVVARAEAVAGLLDAYRVTRGREPARRLTHALTAAGEQLRDGVAAVREVEGLAMSVAALQAAEHDGRHAVRTGIADLVDEEASARELVAWKDIYDQLGAVWDAVAAGARALHAIELKGR